MATKIAPILFGALLSCSVPPGDEACTFDTAAICGTLVGSPSADFSINDCVETFTCAENCGYLFRNSGQVAQCLVDSTSDPGNPSCNQLVTRINKSVQEGCE